MPNKNLKAILAQINPVVGDIKHNCNKIIDVIKSNSEADLIIFPEMALVGYPLMDHILDPLIQEKNQEAIEKIKNVRTESTIILGTFTQPQELEGKFHRFYNSALIIEKNEIKHVENKRLLPTYDIFDEERYFSFDNKFNPVEIKGIKSGILICEDIWDRNYDLKVSEKLVKNGAELLVVINASPYHIGKFQKRLNIVAEKAKSFSVPIIYVNMVGGLDEIVYDGQSFILDDLGNLVFLLDGFKEQNEYFNLSINSSKSNKALSYNRDWRENVLNALTLNLYDYYNKSGIFDGIVLGLSGGIDSAFTAYISAKAVGSEKVTAIMMPTRFTSEKSLALAKALCDKLSIDYKIHPIGGLFDSYEQDIEQNIGKMPFDVADENLQARIRATILMYYSNKFNWLLVSTGNKSEIGVGYCTLYGDTNGGKNVPGDLLKTQIYQICDCINKDREIIPQGIIDRPPTAELREDQKDEDSLPRYEILDKILKEIIENGIGNESKNLKDEGIDKETIEHVRKLYLNSEFKRRQLVQTIRVSESAFGIGRRYPVLKKINF
jgi:NAD+ synthase (glutamine-hydrolysing)